MLEKIQGRHIFMLNDGPWFSINKNSTVRIFVRYDSQHIFISKIPIIKNDKTSMVEVSRLPLSFC